MGFEAIPLPTGSTPQALYAHALTLSTQLRRILQEVAAADIDLAGLTTDITDLQSRVTILEAGAGSGLTAQQLFQLSLTTATSDVLGSIAHFDSLDRTRRQQEADAAMLAAISASEANTGVRSEVRVRIEEDLSLAQQIDTVSADLGVTNATVTSLAQTVSDGDDALATQINTVSSTVAGNTASVQVLSESVNGIQTRFSVAVNAQNETTGFVRLDGTPIGTAFTVAADYFYVGSAAISGGTAVPVFAIQTVGGTAKLALRGDMYADGVITAQHLSAGSVTADKINVTSLSALNADLGTVTAGLIRNAADTLRFDLPSMRLYRVDGKCDFNLSLPRLRMGS